MWFKPSTATVLAEGSPLRSASRLALYSTCMSLVPFSASTGHVMLPMNFLASSVMKYLR